MSRKPDRLQRKKELQVVIAEDLYATAIQVASCLKGDGGNLSRFVESAILLVRGVYLPDATEGVIRHIKWLKVRRYEALEALDAWPQSRRVHLSVDVAALEFCNQLASKYPVVFSSRNEAVILCMAYALEEWEVSRRSNYLPQRLRQVAENHKG